MFKLKAYRTVLKELKSIKKQMHELRNEVRGVVEESYQWILKYSRRIVILNNILLAVYIVLHRFLELFSNNSRQWIKQIFNPFSWTKKSRRRNGEQLTKLLIMLIWKETLRCAVLGFSSYWLTKRENSKKSMACIISFLSHLHTVLFSDISPWTLYFNVFALVMYNVTRYYHKEKFWGST